MSRSTWGRVVLLVVLVVAVWLWRPPLVGGGDAGPTAEGPTTPAPDLTPPTEAPSAGRDEGWLVEWVVDGDTVEVSRDGVNETVRFIGIDTPERDECGYADARAALGDLVEGRPVTLVAGGPTDRDNYGRMLRYVEVDGIDAGLWMLDHGYAAEIYDSRRGKPHDREDEYIAADTATPDLCAFDAG